jgi:hypothetical protein
MLRPPGGCQACRSRRRQEQHYPDFVALTIEPRLQFLDSREVAEDSFGRRRRRLRGHTGIETGPKEDRPTDGQHLTSDDRTTAHHQLEGFLGTALLAAEHETLTPVRHRLPANVLLLLGGD